MTATIASSSSEPSSETSSRFRRFAAGTLTAFRLAFSANSAARRPIVGRLPPSTVLQVEGRGVNAADTCRLSQPPHAHMHTILAATTDTPSRTRNTIVLIVVLKTSGWRDEE